MSDKTEKLAEIIAQGYYKSVWSKNLSDLEKARKFLQESMLDLDNINEVEENITFPLSYSISANLNETKEGLLAVEWLANEKPDNVSIHHIVSSDANYSIRTEEKAEEDARLWLLEFAEFVRDIIRDELKKMYADLFDEDEDMPPRKYPLIVSRPRKYFFPE